jgi:antitoxin component YwqK of YwqJK toxin-antitoxin module
MEKRLLIFNLFTWLIIATSSFAQKNQVDAKGRKQGVWEKQYPNSLVFEYKGQFKDDKPVGTFTFYYSNTKVKAIVKHNEKTGRSESYMYHDNGVLMAFGIYLNQKKDSVWTQFGPSGRLSYKDTYKNGVLNGKMTVYYVPEDLEDKSQKIAKTCTYQKGKIEGEAIEYFDNGIVKSKCLYQKGEKHGLCIFNHSNGQPMMHEHYRYGVRYGYFMAFDETGKEIGRKYYRYGSILEGDELKKWIEECKSKGQNPYD